MGRKVGVVVNRGHRVFTATVHRRQYWSSDYPYIYGVHFDGVRHAGRYRLLLGDFAVRSPALRVTTPAAVWTRILRYGVRFAEVQRDGAAVVRAVLHRRPSHLLDRHAYIYARPHFQPGSDVIKDRTLHRIGGPVNVAGGWFDAGDYLKFTHDPFAAGVDDTNFDVDSHTLGLIATAGRYASLTRSRRYVALAAKLRGQVFGANAWGVSTMVGIGSAFPHCMQHQVANLAGSTNGRPPLDLGAVVNGPNGAGLFTGGLGGFQDGMVHCPGPGSPAAVPARTFDGSGSVYLDDVRSWQTDEPALDMTGAAIIAAASQLAAHR